VVDLAASERNVQGIRHMEAWGAARQTLDSTSSAPPKQARSRLEAAPCQAFEFVPTEATEHSQKMPSPKLAPSQISPWFERIHCRGGWSPPAEASISGAMCRACTEALSTANIQASAKLGPSSWLTVAHSKLEIHRVHTDP
jgi:hypothetical protein